MGSARSALLFDEQCPLVSAACSNEPLETLPRRVRRGLAASIGKLAKLERLDLQGSSIKELPEEMGTMARLQALELRKNELTTYSLPSTIDGWKRITRLCLAYDDNGNGTAPGPGQMTKLTTTWVQ